MMNFLRKHMKIIALLIWPILVSSVAVYAYGYLASDVSYTKTGTDIKNVGQALDTLYTIQTSCPHPVGYVFLSTTQMNLSELYPGTTWEQIQDVFLLMAGTKYSAGSTGGEATHTLTVNEMPSHNHGFPTTLAGIAVGWGCVSKSDGSRANSNVSAFYYNTNNTGGSQPHNNMPPYYTIYGYKRTK